MAEGFEGSSSDPTFERQKQVMSQIRHKLEMLHRVWLVSVGGAKYAARLEADRKPSTRQTVLTEARCLSSIGVLVETAVARVADDIIAISDITADESERLKQICEVLKHVEDIFSGHVSVIRRVPVHRSNRVASIGYQHCRLCATLVAILLRGGNHGELSNEAANQL